MRTEQIAAKICDQLIKFEAAKTEDWELLHYGIFQMLITLEQVWILLIAGVVLEILTEITIFTACYALLRKYIGGAHAKTHLSCLLTFTCLAIAIPLICVQCPTNNVLAFVIFLLHCMVILVYLRAPVVHPNNPKSVKTLLRFRKMGIRIAIIEYTLIMLATILVPNPYKNLLLCGACGAWMAAMTLVFPLPEQEGGD